MPCFAALFGAFDVARYVCVKFSVEYSADQDEAIRLQEILARLRDLPKPILPDWEHFQSREPALGLSHEDSALVPFTVLRGKMLEQLIECDCN